MFGEIVGVGWEEQRGWLGQMEKDLEGLVKQVGLGYSCARDLGTSQKEEA